MRNTVIKYFPALWIWAYMRAKMHYGFNWKSLILCRKYRQCPCRKCRL